MNGQFAARLPPSG